MKYLPAGMDQILPTTEPQSWTMRFFKHVTVLFGEPIDLADTIAELRAKGASAVCLHLHGFVYTSLTQRCCTSYFSLLLALGSSASPSSASFFNLLLCDFHKSAIAIHVDQRFDVIDRDVLLDRSGPSCLTVFVIDRVRFRF